MHIPIRRPALHLHKSMNIAEQMQSHPVAYRSAHEAQATRFGTMQALLLQAIKNPAPHVVS